MAVFGASGFHHDSGGTTGEAIYIASPPVGSYVSKIDIQGNINAAVNSQSLTTGLFANFGLAAGIQFGPSGYTPVVITDGSAGGASWWSFGNLLPPQDTNLVLAGASPQPFTRSTIYAINLSLRQYIAINTAVDVYLIIGGDSAAGLVPLFESFLSYNMEWATFP